MTPMKVSFRYRLSMGELEAWDDPACILDLMENPLIDERTASGAVRACRRMANKRERWTDHRVATVLVVLKNGWDVADCQTKFSLVTAVSDADRGSEIHRRAVRMFCDLYDASGRDDHGKEAFDVKSMRDWSNGGEEPKWHHSGYGDVYDFIHHLHCYLGAPGLSYTSSDLWKTSCKVFGNNAVESYFRRTFPDPVIWAPDTMSRNRRRR